VVVLSGWEVVCFGGSGVIVSMGRGECDWARMHASKPSSGISLHMLTFIWISLEIGY